MPLSLFKHTGKKSSELAESVIFFFQFLGALTDQIMNHWSRVIWHHTVSANLRVGASLVLPLVLISVLIGMAMALGIHVILAPFHLQQEAMIIAQTNLLQDLAPFTIGFVLCVHCGLNLIDTNHPSLNHPPYLVIRETIIPLMVGINITALSLYTYVYAAFILSVYFTSSFIVHTNTSEYLFRLAKIINTHELISSLIKTLGYTTLASLIASYYYYGVAYKIMTTRAAVSRVITRSLFWLIVISVLFKIIVP